MDDQSAFLQTIRRSLGLSPTVERSKKLFSHLFTRTNTSSILEKINDRTVEEQDRLVDILQANAHTLGITTHIVGNLDEAAAVVIELVRSNDPEFTHSKHIIHHDQPDLNALQLWKRFTREGISVHTAFSADLQLREKTIASFIGLTAPNIGVADSATLIQLTEPGCPRSTSLVPSLHIALLRRENLVADLGEAYALLQEKAQLDSIVFITGPSKTADIEAHMVHGAHGPREVQLLILAPQTIKPPAEKPEIPAETAEPPTT